MKTISKFFTVCLIIAAIVIAGFWVFQKMRNSVGKIDEPSANNPTSTNNSESNQAFDFGNPDKAASNPSNSSNYLISGKYYTVSYNHDKGIPNWVSWTLSATDKGVVNRQNDFRPNTDLPSGWKRINPNDYSGSGYTRGHLCPAGDRSSSPEANSSTFLMTNMTPQTHDLNAGPWEDLEKYSRILAKKDAKLYIIAGHYGENGKIRNKVTIPANFWKIVIITTNGTEINGNSRVIAVDMPNIDGILEKPWRDYRTTINQIEQKTGYNFLTNLPMDVQNSLESKEDTR